MNRDFQLFRKLIITGLFIGSLLLVGVMGVGDQIRAASLNHRSDTNFKIGEILVKFKSVAEPIILKIDEEGDPMALAKEISERPDIDYAEPNYIYSLAAFDPNDFEYPQQWYLRQIGMPLAWEKSTGSPEIIVAVLDTGVDINHPDLMNNIWRNPGEVESDNIDNDKNGFTDDIHGWDFIDWSNDPRPDATPPYSRTALHHGTVVAGLIAAIGNNVEGVAGVAWRTRIMSLRVLDRQGQGDVENVARAVEYATNNGASIINLSFVGNGASQRLEAALARAYAAGVLVVVAAGNADNASGINLDDSPRYPACYDANSRANWILGV